MGNVILAIDHGTTSSRTIIFDHSGQPRTIQQQEFKQYFPRPGWVEHNPEEIWESQINTIRQAVQEAKVSPKDIEAIGITNQRETTVI